MNTMSNHFAYPEPPVEPPEEREPARPRWPWDGEEYDRYEEERRLGYDRRQIQRTG